MKPSRHGRGNLPRKRKQKVIKNAKGKCMYCGGAATTVDHIVPRSKGGSDKQRNLAAACFSCNQKKADRLISPPEYKLKKGMSYGL